MEGETSSERKSRLAELAKAIKAKKTDISKNLEKVNTEVKKSLAVRESVRKRETRTVQEEVERLDHETVVSTQEVEEVRGKTGVIRRRVKGGVAPVAPVREARTPEVEAPHVREPEPEPEVEAPVVHHAKAPVASEPEPEPEPVVETPAEASRVAAKQPEPEPETREVTPAPAPISRQPAPVEQPMAAAPATPKPAGAPPVALIKRAGRDVTPAGLTFTPHQPRPTVVARPAGEGGTERGAPVPGTEKRGPGGKREIFELKEMTFGPGQFPGGRRKRVIPKKQQQKTQITTPKAIKRKIAIEGAITVGALAQRMAVKVGDVMKKLMGMGMMVTVNQSIDADTATLVASEFGYEVSNVEFNEAEVLGAEAPAEAEALLEPRPPVVTIMGHVDHGKTSLLDAIRKTNVAGGEAGGITQHIGAYQIKVDDRKITFLDTPGHEAFTSMRARGAKITDIVVLVTAVDDGPQPQTIEAINHAKSANVPIIVALNKVDKPGTDPEKIMQKLGGEHGLTPEEWGGETMYVKTSAKTGLGIKDLLESILVRSDVMELKANPNKPAVGTIVEAKIDKGRGPVATVLVQEGTLKVGDAVVSGPWYGKVRAMMDERGKAVKEARPATPVEVLGLSGVPDAGDPFHVAADVDAAKSVAEHRTAKARETTLGGGGSRKVSMDNLFAGAGGGIKELNIIVKADVQGSVEALKHALEKLSTEKVKVNVVAGSVGAISESDVLLATASKAIIVGFNVKPDNRGREMAEQEHVDVRTYSIIYEALDEARNAMVGLLEPIFRETQLGKAEVRNIFQSSKVGAVAGCMVTEGKIKRNAKVRVVRGGKVVFDGKIASLRRFKDDAGEVLEGFECGLSVDGFADVQVGDQIACYTVEQVAATL
jgi:translation initiation factor IF-2